MKHIFVINPVAGKGKAAAAIIPKIKQVCAESGVDYELYLTTKAGDGIDYVRKMAQTGEQIRFYACGGDGTLYEIVNGAYGCENAQVAVVPLGSGNDFIRLFGTIDDFLVLNNQINGVPVELDVIKCGDEIAINQCSMGLDAEVCAKQASFKKLPLMTGEGAYVASSLYGLMRKVSNVFTVSIDGGEPQTKTCLFCVAANSRWYGGGFMAAPNAFPDDGMLDLMVVEKTISRLKLVTLLNDYKAGKHLDWPFTHMVRGKKMTIHCDTPAAVNVDGECHYVKDCTFEIVEKGITFVVPAGSRFLAEREQRLAKA